jgi:hypothetical protein
VRLGNDKAIIDWAAKRVADPKKFSDLLGALHRRLGPLGRARRASEAR